MFLFVVVFCVVSLGSWFESALRSYVMKTNDVRAAKRCWSLVRLLYRLRVCVVSCVCAGVDLKHCKTVEGFDG